VNVAAALARPGKDFAAHRCWMIRNYLPFAAATLRLELALRILAGLPGLVAFKTVAWSSWVPNLAIAEGWIRRR
jgi:Predicted membrane protein (DUF2306)